MTHWGLPRARNRQELIAKDHEGLSRGDVNVLKLWQQLRKSMNILKNIELHNLSKWIVWYVKYISIKINAHTTPLHREFGLV